MRHAMESLEHSRILKKVIKYWNVSYRYTVTLLCLWFLVESFSPVLPMSVLNAQKGKNPISGAYTNPVGGITRIGDPFVMLFENRYYLYTTSAGDGFKCWTSHNLVNWKPLGYAYQRNKDSWGRDTYWAPEIIYYNDKFYMVYSCNKKGTPRGQRYLRLCLATSDRPEGPFADLYAPWFDIGWSCIDGNIFIDDDGTPYLYFAQTSGKNETPGSYHLNQVYGVKLAFDLSHIIDEPVLCLNPEQEWENPHSTEVRCNEGPFTFKHNGIYYMTYSGNGYFHSYYGIGYATALSPLGPWTKSITNPIVEKNLEIGVSGPGHNSITKSPDRKELFMVYHTHTDPKHPSGNRNVNIDRLAFDENGNLHLIGPTRTPQPMPSGTK